MTLLTDTIKDTSRDITKTITESSFKSNEALIIFKLQTFRNNE